MPRTSETLIEQSKYYDAEAQRAKAVIDAEFDYLAGPKGMLDNPFLTELQEVMAGADLEEKLERLRKLEGDYKEDSWEFNRRIKQILARSTDEAAREILNRRYHERYQVWLALNALIIAVKQQAEAARVARDLLKFARAFGEAGD
ncbi:MAG: hypothetical protein KDD90_03550 [Sphingomonadaceae bacterium]|jgi:AcrR family transcriptional regulator|nr:hypothetical protein [Sphingomonadaceae bacterium]